jgi:hypothetical protein
MRQTVEERASQIIEDIGLDESMEAGHYTTRVAVAFRTAIPEGNANPREALPCGHPRACLYPDYCPPEEPGWRSRTDVFCTACQREASNVAEARSQALEEAYQECWVSRNSDEIADGILALIANE